jgi:hypothetical protein
MQYWSKIFCVCAVESQVFCIRARESNVSSVRRCDDADGPASMNWEIPAGAEMVRQIKNSLPVFSVSSNGKSITWITNHEC